MKFGERVQAERERLGMSRYRLEKSAGLAAGTVAAIETGRRQSLTGGNLVAVAGVLGVTAEWLVTGRTATEPTEREAG